MIYLIFGEDNFRIKERVKEIIKKEGGKVESFDFTRDNFLDFKKERFRKNLFSEKRIFLLKNFLTLPLKEKDLAGLKLKESKESFIFIEEKENLRNSSIFFFLKKIAKIEKFSRLKRFQLKRWVKAKFKEFDKKIEDKEIDLLLDYTGEDLWHLFQEIRKLSSFEINEYITKEDIKTLTFPNFEVNSFKIIDSLFKENKKKALFYLSKYFKKKESPIVLFSLISSQVKNLLLIRELIDRKENLFQIERKLKLHPYLLKKLFYLAKNFNFKNIKEFFNKIFNLEIKIKNGQIKPERAIWFLISEI